MGNESIANIKTDDLENATIAEKIEIVKTQIEEEKKKSKSKILKTRNIFAKLPYVVETNANIKEIFKMLGDFLFLKLYELYKQKLKEKQEPIITLEVYENNLKMISSNPGYKDFDYNKAIKCFQQHFIFLPQKKGDKEYTNKMRNIYMEMNLKILLFKIYNKSFVKGRKVKSDILGINDIYLKYDKLPSNEIYLDLECLLFFTLYYSTINNINLKVKYLLDILNPPIQEIEPNFKGKDPSNELTLEHLQKIIKLFRIIIFYPDIEQCNIFSNITDSGKKYELLKDDEVQEELQKKKLNKGFKKQNDYFSIDKNILKYKYFLLFTLCDDNYLQEMNSSFISNYILKIFTTCTQKSKYLDKNISEGINFLRTEFYFECAFKYAMRNKISVLVDRFPIVAKEITHDFRNYLSKECFDEIYIRISKDSQKNQKNNVFKNENTYIFVNNPNRRKNNEKNFCEKEIIKNICKKKNYPYINLFVEEVFDFIKYYAVSDFLRQKKNKVISTKSYSNSNIFQLEDDKNDIIVKNKKLTPKENIDLEKNKTMYASIINLIEGNNDSEKLQKILYKYKNINLKEGIVLDNKGNQVLFDRDILNEFHEINMKTSNLNSIDAKLSSIEPNKQEPKEISKDNQEEIKNPDLNTSSMYDPEKEAKLKNLYSLIFQRKNKERLSNKLEEIPMIEKEELNSIKSNDNNEDNEDNSRELSQSKRSCLDESYNNVQNNQINEKLNNEPEEEKNEKSRNIDNIEESNKSNSNEDEVIEIEEDSESFTSDKKNINEVQDVGKLINKESKENKVESEENSVEEVKKPRNERNYINDDIQEVEEEEENTVSYLKIDKSSFYA